MNKYELVNFCEFDDKAAKSYCAIHNVDEKLNLGDITKVDETKLPYFNFICGGSPCQDFSIAGKQKGSIWICGDCGYEYNPITQHYTKREYCPKCNSVSLDKSRSSLLVEWLRMIRGNKPNWGIYENVKNIVGVKFKSTFDLFIKELEEYGYNTYYQILNAKNYGIPQNRERVYVFIVKKELDSGFFEFPKQFDYIASIKNIIENNVDDKYYKICPSMIKAIEDKKCKILKEDGISSTLTTKQNRWNNAGFYYDKDKALVCEHRYDEGIRTFKDNVFGTLMTTSHCGNKMVYHKEALRFLTEKECFRLMGFSDEDFIKAQQVNKSSNTLYKQAGNSIVVNVLYEIYKAIYLTMPYLFDNLKVSSFFSGIGAFEKALDVFYDEIN